MQQEIEHILRLLQVNGYVARSQVAWGQTSADVPYGWESGTTSALYQSDVDSGAKALAAFQVCSSGSLPKVF